MSIISAQITKAALIGLALLTSALVFHHPSRAADQPNVLIMGDDADEDTVPRHSTDFQ